MVIRECPVALAKENERRESDALEKLLCDKRACTVTTIDHAVDIAGYLADSVADIVHVAIDYRFVAKLPFTAREFARERELINLLDVFPVDGSLSNPKLESIELGRIV
jgi:hypothetical protein